jgi:hypothetical protein
MEILAKLRRTAQTQALAQKPCRKIGPKAFLIGVSSLLFFYSSVSANRLFQIPLKTVSPIRLGKTPK